jgi:hypothetical protein
MHDHEVHSLRNGRRAELVSLLYDLEESDETSLSSPTTADPPATKKRGYKRPDDVQTRRALLALGTHWPRAKLVVEVRHTVRWFESFYNFHRYNRDHGKPGAKRLGPVLNMSVPTHAFFHVHLSYLGKTNATTYPDEQKLLRTASRLAANGEANATTVFASSAVPTPARMSNLVFLYEAS